MNNKMNERLYDFYELNNESIYRLFHNYDRNLEIVNIIKINEGMSTSNYIVECLSKNFFLKIYSNDIDNIELKMYDIFKDLISIPKLYYSDFTKTMFPFSYIILEYIESINLDEYIKKEKRISSSIISEIAETLAIIHNKKYDRSGLLDINLEIKDDIKTLKEQTLFFLNSKAGDNIGEYLKTNLLDIISNNHGLYEIIDNENVLCHGDFSFKNIMIDNDSKPFFIDFEYSLAISRYFDIGKLFRRRDDNVNMYIDSNFYIEFKEAYNYYSTIPLPDNYLILAKLADLPGLLSFINNDNPVEEWLDDIKIDIAYLIGLFNKNI